MVDQARARRVAERIKDVVAANLGQVVKDPTLGFVTITDVRVTGDLQQASIFYTVLGDADQAAHTAKLLTHNTGKLRSLVGKHLGIRLTPSLEFVADALPDAAAHIEELLQAAREKDAQVAASAEGAAYAGDADPYKHPDEAEEAESTPVGLTQRADA
ncbi:MAG: 30S ribosome-binding factor RbfA [Tetrasphaera sp.]